MLQHTAYSRNARARFEAGNAMKVKPSKTWYRSMAIRLRIAAHVYADHGMDQLGQSCLDRASICQWEADSFS